MTTPRLSLLKPPALQPGDTVGIVAPASPPPDPQSVDRALAAVTQLGFKPRLARHARQRHGFLAGTDRQRAADLMQMFQDPVVRAIFCLRGGYGTARLLPLLDYSVIRSHPKILVGYSDLTSLHCALLVKAGLVTFHGPMVCSDWLKPRPPAFTRTSFLQAVTRIGSSFSLLEGCSRHRFRALRNGLASGPLLGGNLSILCSTLGTPWQPRFKDSILFLEEVDEPPYRIDRLLTQLLNAGVLQQVRGVALGSFKNCLDPKAASAREYRQTVDDVLSERLRPLRVPVLAGLPFGHQPFNATLPIGCSVTLDANRLDLSLLEPVVAQPPP